MKKTIIIFDLWQTLADSSVRPSDLFEALSVFDTHSTRDEFLHRLFTSDLYTKDISLEDGIKGFLATHGFKDQGIIDTLKVLWGEMASKSFLFEGVDDLLKTLQDSGYTLALLTNIDKYGYENFSNNAVFGHFDYKFLSYREGILKPDFRCWEQIKKHYSTEYGDMVMIGDSSRVDIEPARELGMPTILISDTMRAENLASLVSEIAHLAVG